MLAKLLGLSAFAAGFLLESGLQMEMYACRAKTLSESLLAMAMWFVLEGRHWCFHKQSTCFRLSMPRCCVRGQEWRRLKVDRYVPLQVLFVQGRCGVSKKTAGRVGGGANRLMRSSDVH